MRSLVNTSLNFASAEIQGIDQAQLEVQDLAEALQNLASINITQIEELKEYYDGEYSFNFSPIMSRGVTRRGCSHYYSDFAKTD